ncbi:DUF4892 domain-containing protein [Candidatus Litorirhabdus singularis]|nr:DUF4892 domain-containing protein [Candidatus Litorirhabdus singularis]
MVVSVLVWLAASVAYAADPLPALSPAIFAEFLPEPYPHSTQAVEQGPTEVDYLLGLGAMQKVGGRWRHKESEQIDGELLRLTWAINQDYTAQEAFEWMRDQVTENAQVLFECDGRSCGSSAQWASRVFDQRLLYGHDERQQYLVARIQQDGATYTYVIYAIDRANRRHYLHLDLIRHSN